MSRTFRFVAGLFSISMLALSLVGSATAAPSVGNSSFETPALGSGNYAYNPTGATWTFNTHSGIQTNGSPWTDGGSNAPNGVQAAFLQDGEASGACLEQSVSGFDGAAYNLVVSVAQRGNGMGDQSVEVSLDGASKGTVTPTSASYVDFTVDLGAPASGAHTLKFCGMNTGDESAFIDNVRVNSAGATKTGTYYVNSASSCPGSGTSNSPWCNFDTVNASIFGAGAQILLARGSTWYQPMELTGSGTSWNAGGFITVDAYGTGARPIIRGNSLVTDKTITLTNPDYWKIQNLELCCAGGGILAWFTSLSHQGIRLDSMLIHDIDWQGAAFVTSGTILNPTSTQWVIKDITIGNSEIYGAQPFVFFYGPPDYTDPGNVYNVQNIVVKNNYFHDNPNTATTFNASHITILSNVFDTMATIWQPQGTTGVFIIKTTDLTMVNNMIVNVPNTNASDMSGVDIEGWDDQIRFRSNYIAGNAGAGLEYLALSGRNGDYNTNNEVSGNAFSGNATAGNATYRGSLLRSQSTGASFTGSASNNLYYEPTGFTIGPFTNWTFTNNLTVASASQLFNGAASFGSTPLDGWSYEYWNGTSYVGLSYAAANQWYGSSTGYVNRFNLLPNNTNGNYIARTWTAGGPGTVSIRGWVLKNDTAGGDGILAKITKNGSIIWPTGGSPQTIAYNDQVGVSTNLDSVSVSAGDRIRFEVNRNANNTNDLTSWSPSIAFTSGGGGGGGTEGSLVTGRTLGTLRNDTTSEAGMRIDVAGSPITVTKIGRYFVSGNTANHTLKIVRKSDLVTVASVVIDMDNAGAADSLGFKYATLGSSVTLSANTSYYVTSTETNGGDQFYDTVGTVQTTTSAASIPFSVYGTPYTENALTGNTYGPVNIVYTTAGGSNLAPSATTSSSSTDFGNGYCDCRINNGDLGDFTGWANAPGEPLPQWVQLDWTSSQTVGRVVFTTTNGYETKDFQIQYWNGSSWVTPSGASITGNTLKTRTVSFAAVSTQKVRVYGTLGDQYGFIRVDELEVYTS